jgi:hypothetical protein
MAFKDGLQDTATINSVSIGFKSGDTIGQQVKTKVALYSNIPCRLNSLSNAALSLALTDRGKQEGLKESWIMQVEPQYNGADRGFEVVSNGKNFVITKKHEIRGKNPAVNHVVYYLEEAK